MKSHSYIIEISNTTFRFPMNNLKVCLYDYPTTINDGTIFGTPSISADGTVLVAKLLTDNIGRYKFDNIKSGLYTIIALGQGIRPQVLSGYEKFDIGFGYDLTGSDIPYMDNTNVSIENKIKELENRIKVLEA